MSHHGSTSRGRLIAGGLLACLLAMAAGGDRSAAQEPAQPALPNPGAARPLRNPAKGGAEKDANPFHGAILIDASGGQYRDPLRLNQLLDEVRRTPFSDIVLQVRVFGDAYYDSAVVPRAYGVAEMKSETEKFDPLKDFIAGLKSDPKDAKKKVWAWIDPFRVGNANRAVPEADGHVATAHPDWLTRNSQFKTQDEDGNIYLEPGLEVVQAHLEQVVAELAGSHEIDGLLIDGVRYPGFASDWGYHTKTLEAWRSAAGKTDAPAPLDPMWLAMRQSFLNSSLDRMAKAAKGARPGLIVAATALAEGDAPPSLEAFKDSLPCKGAMQDWLAWMKDKRADQIHLLNHRNEGDAAALFDAWNAFASKAAQAHGVEVVIGVAGSENISLDALAQVRRVHEAGFLGAELSNFAEPIQDASTRKLFFDALGNNVLSSGSRRLAWKDVASAAPTEAPAEAEPAATPTPEPTPQEAIPLPPQTPEPSRPQIEDILRTPVPGPAKVIEPNEDALNFLRKNFGNIFDLGAAPPPRRPRP